MRPGRRLVAAILVLAAFLPRPSFSQIHIRNFNVATGGFPASIGQSALDARVTFAQNDATLGAVYTSLGVAGASFGTSPWVGCRVAENSAGNLFWLSTLVFSGTPNFVQKFGGGGGSVTYPTTCKTWHIVPLTGGRVLVRLVCAGDPSADFRIYDDALNLVGSFAGLPGTSAVQGMTRRPDGSIVAASSTSGGPHLTAYLEDGTVLWDHTITTPGALASDPEGNLYLLASTSLIHVYDSHGVFHHTWGGTASVPLASVKDIASSRDGTLLFAVRTGNNGPMNVYGEMPTPARSSSWGQIKALYGSTR